MSYSSIDSPKNLLIAAIIFAIFARFLSIAGLDFHKFGGVLNAYFQDFFRIVIFAIQFLGLMFVFNEIFLAKLSKKTLFVAIAFMTVVSVIRYFVPIFFVCLIGDLLIIWWLLSALKSTYQNYH